LVDPAFAATYKEVGKPAGYATLAIPVESTKNAARITPARGVLRGQRTKEQGTRLSDIQTTLSTDGDWEECLILSDPEKYLDRASLWKAQDWDTAQTLKETKHKSRPYHDGCSTLALLTLSHVGVGAREADVQEFKAKRNLVSPLDEMVFYWTKIATPELINQTKEQSSNAAYYLLKHVAQHWVSQLELINTTISKGEWLSDDYQAKIDDNLSLKKWKDELIKVNNISKDINYMRRHLNHFWRSMVLNLERLGVQLGAEGIDNSTPLALQGAQRDFLTIHARMHPLRDRAEALTSVSNDLANLRAAFRGVHDGEFSLRLSLFASTIFPLTLVASIFSMSNDYQPGSPHFWKLWAIGPPFCIAIALGMVYGTRPWMIFSDIREALVTWLTRHGLMDVKDGTAEYRQESEAEKVTSMKKDEDHC
jgi:CorA-like Mg2+ transporter protein